MPHEKRDFQTDKMTKALWLIVEGTASTLGVDFFASLVQTVAQTLQVSCAFVTECTDESRTRVRTLAYWEQNGLLNPVEYEVAGTPCAYVMAGKTIFYPRDVQKLFVGEDNVEGYIGIPLFDPQGIVIGHLVVTDEEPLLDEQVLAILQIFAARASAELNRIRTERALLLSREHFQTLFDAAPVGMLMTNAHSQIIQANRAALTIFGLSALQLHSRMVTDLIFFEEVERCRIQFENLACGQFRHFEAEHRFQRPDGEMVWCRLSGFALRDGGGKYLCTMVTVEDITERKRIEDERRHAYKILEAHVQARTHEIEQRRKVAESLREVLAILNSSYSLEEMLDYIVKQAVDILGGVASAVCSLTADHEICTVNAAAGLQSTARIETHYFPAWQVMAEVIQMRRPVAISTVESRPDLTLESAQVAIAPFRALLAIPLVVKQEVYGCLVVYYAYPRQFSDEEIALGVMFGDQVSLAIENARLHRLVEQAAVMSERSRLARELHDSVSQSLYSLTLLAEGWRRLIKAGRLENVEESLGEMGEIAQQALNEMRLLIYELRPPMLEQGGLIMSLHQRLNAVEKRAGIKTHLVADLDIPLPAKTEEAIYRIVQEALNNSLKHSTATQIDVCFQHVQDKLTVDVVDNGCGFNLTSLPNDGGLGLKTMSERAEALGGKLEITSTPQKGTQVRLSIPYPQAIDLF